MVTSQQVSCLSLLLCHFIIITFFFSRLASWRVPVVLPKDTHAHTNTHALTEVANVRSAVGDAMREVRQELVLQEMRKSKKDLCNYFPYCSPTHLFLLGTFTISNINAIIKPGKLILQFFISLLACAWKKASTPLHPQIIKQKMVRRREEKKFFLDFY